jgi:uncharacterized membrane protein
MQKKGGKILKHSTSSSLGNKIAWIIGGVISTMLLFLISYSITGLLCDIMGGSTGDGLGCFAPSILYSAALCLLYAFFFLRFVFSHKQKEPSCGVFKKILVCIGVIGISVVIIIALVMFLPV